MLIGGDLKRYVLCECLTPRERNLPLGVQTRERYGEKFLLACTHKVQWTTFTWVDDRTFLWSYAVLAEGNGLREIVFDQETRSKGDNLR